MKNSFTGGVHPADNKELSKGAQITEMPVSDTLYFALRQHIGKPAVPVVKAGDKVKIGTVLARADGFVSANIVSSVSGTVRGMVKRTGTDGLPADCIAVDNDRKDEAITLAPLVNPTGDEIIERIREAGIVGMGGAGFPTAVKLKPRTPCDVLVINAAECEPYITCDYRVMMEYAEQFLQGVAYLKLALGAERAIIGIEDNKPDAAKRIADLIESKGITDITVGICPVKYPQGAEKQLIYATTGRAVPAGGLPADAGVVVQNVHTALSTYFAVADGQPLFRRVMTVTGHGCASPANMWVRVGTPASEIIEHCGLAVTEEQLAAAEAKLAEAEQAYAHADKPARKEAKRALKAAKLEAEAARGNTVAKIVSGGPMMGIALVSTEVATTKTSSCLLLMTNADVAAPEPTACIGCSKCVSVCPMKLMPNMIASYTGAADYDGAVKYGAKDCIQCGCCAYICPAKRPLVQTIAYAKKKIKENGK